MLMTDPTRHTVRDAGPLGETALWILWRLAVVPVALLGILAALTAPLAPAWYRYTPTVHAVLTPLPGRLTTAVVSAHRHLAARPAAAYVATVAAVLVFAVLSGLVSH